MNFREIDTTDAMMIAGIAASAAIGTAGLVTACSAKKDLKTVKDDIGQLTADVYKTQTAVFGCNENAML